MTKNAQETPVQKKPPTKNYINNALMLEEVIKSKAQGKMSDELARMLMLLCSMYASKGNFVGYTYNDDMQAYALLMLTKTWSAFDPSYGKAPFAFYTQCVHNSFVQYLNREKRHRVIRDSLLVNSGMNPSHGYKIEEGSDRHIVDDEEDFHSQHPTASVELDDADILVNESTVVDVTEEYKSNNAEEQQSEE